MISEVRVCQLSASASDTSVPSLYVNILRILKGLLGLKVQMHKLGTVVPYSSSSAMIDITLFQTMACAIELILIPA